MRPGIAFVPRRWRRWGSPKGHAPEISGLDPKYRGRGERDCLALDAELADARLERGRLEPEALRRAALAPDPPADLVECGDDVSSLDRLQRHLDRGLLHRRHGRIDVQDRAVAEDDRP